MTSISIHAPGWGATTEKSILKQAGLISIHAPGWGATTAQVGIAQVGIISIHAPGWGATPARLCDVLIFVYFNPRTRVGCD